MTKVSEIMSRNVPVLDPRETLRNAARLMRQLDVGLLPVCEGMRLVGMLSDRDIAVRGVAEGLDTEVARVGDVMTGGKVCTEDQDADAILSVMGARQVRRLPVVDRERHLVGIVSLNETAALQGDAAHAVLRDFPSPVRRAPVV